MTRLYVVAEGQTEVNFVNIVLKPQLQDTVQVDAPNLRGHKSFAQTSKFIRNLLHRRDTELRVTTMIDLFKLPADYPGKSDPVENDSGVRVQRLERRFAEEIADPRFLPYLQLHEFEALVLANIGALTGQHPNREKAIFDLAGRVARFPSPEEINHMRPPSYWIKDAVPEYNKVLDGVNVVAQAGLPELRARCPHFGAWLSQIESLISGTKR